MDSDSQEDGVAGSKSVLYQDLVAILTEAMQAQGLEIFRANERLDELERSSLQKDEEIYNLARRIKKLEAFLMSVSGDDKTVTMTT